MNARTAPGTGIILLIGSALYAVFAIGGAAAFWWAVLGGFLGIAFSFVTLWQMTGDGWVFMRWAELEAYASEQYAATVDRLNRRQEEREQAYGDVDAAAKDALDGKEGASDRLHDAANRIVKGETRTPEAP